MEIELRRELPTDYRETENVVREAFWNHYTPGCDDHYLVHIMRKCPAFVPELDIVAVCGGKIIGNVVFLRSYIMGDNGEKHDVLSLGPIAVLPEYQRKGIGGKMIEYAKKLALKMGFRAILLCGDPEIYSRKGFVPAETLGIRNSDNMYFAPLHVYELYCGALSNAKGRYYENDIYNIDEALVLEFDKQFPPKEVIIGTPSQKRFEFMSTQTKPANREVLREKPRRSHLER